MSTITQNTVQRIGKWSDSKFNKKSSQQAQSQGDNDSHSQVSGACDFAVV